ncbi:HAD family hydrolase [Streptomyces sp. NPDC005279]|uniref:HAD family hydrolase n=1 Tax=Streptomyces sp. NPDC005279 TaxID=3364712 RepID=UPI0036797E9F
MTEPRATDLRDLLAAVKCVLLDFDGPICQLFARHTAPVVAAELRDWIQHRFHDEVPVPEGSVDDPHAILSAADDRHRGSELVGHLEELLTAEELRASVTAHPTKDANRLIRRLSAVGFRLAITTNNSASAVRSYLDREGLTDFFGEHVHGRMPDPRLLKPNPDCLRRALETTGSTAEESLMIGDSPADYEAAKELGVRFLGYARNQAKRRRLEAVGEMPKVSSLGQLLDAVEPGLRVE